MISPLLKKLLDARQLVIEAEDLFIKEKKICPYEIGSILRNFDNIIENFDEDMF